MITIKDISRISGFSVTTVSRAMNNYTDISTETKKKILQICDEQGYIPNALGRNLSTKRTYTIGIVFQEETSLGLTHPFFAELLNSFKIEVEKRGYDILLIGQKIGKYVHSYLSHIKQKSVDGIIVLSSFPEANEIKELCNDDIPKVFMQTKIEGQSCFYSDNYHAICKVFRHLYDLGHRKIGFISGDTMTLDGKDRFDGYVDSLTKYNCIKRDDYIKYGLGYSFEEGINSAREFISLKEDMPTAIICASDTLAIGCMKELTDQGFKVPEDISVSGFDNITLANLFSPKVTTVNQNKDVLARRATTWLIGKIEKENFTPVHDIVDCEIIIRESCGKVK